MAIRSLEILGYRGFGDRQRVEFAIPDGRPGSGLTIIVGANNSGKSSLVEALRLFSNSQAPSLSESKRNKKAGDRVTLQLDYDPNERSVLQTTGVGGSETTFAPANNPNLPKMILALPSRRYFEPFFNKGTVERQAYSGQMIGLNRGSNVNFFAQRLFKIQNDPQIRASFEYLLHRVIDPVPKWYIDLWDSGQYFLKFETRGLFHNSEGLGEGLVSLLFIIDSLYDSTDGHVIAIDEPELSLHPAIQRGLAELFMEHSTTKQLILATHSPYFLPLESLRTGATVARVFAGKNGSGVAQLGATAKAGLLGLLDDLNNPHVLGLDAREVFFLDDGIILVEGQEDVIFYKRMAEQLGSSFDGEFYGWGVGGADKMPVVAALLDDLGFTRVVGILDGNKREQRDKLQLRFPRYTFLTIPADDVRSRREVSAKQAVAGLLDHGGALPERHRTAAEELLRDVNQGLARAAKAERT